MQKLLRLLTGIYLTITVSHTWGQITVNNATYLGHSSDNVGEARKQTGTEVIASAIGAGVTFTAGSSYEHVGQFHVADDGIWNAAGTGTNTGTDIFGYAPKEIGSYLPYQGVGIKGASSSNGGTGRPCFGHLQLNSTGEFPVLGGIYVSDTLEFDGSGPQTGNIITTPLATSVDAIQVVTFAPNATVIGVSEINYINGYARVVDPIHSFTLPIGYPTTSGSSLHTLTVNQTVQGSITSRYLPGLQHSSTALGDSIYSVYPASNWQIDVPAGTRVTVTVTLADTILVQNDASALRLVGWNGSAWVKLSTGVTDVADTERGYQVSGTVIGQITDLAIGFAGIHPRERPSPLTIWPNPTQEKLFLNLPTDQSVQRISVLDLKGRLLLTNFGQTSTIDVSALPAGSYLVEVHTTNKQAFRHRFVKH